MKKFLALSLSDVVFIMVINVKMSTIVGILTIMSRSDELSMGKVLKTLGLMFIYFSTQLKKVASK